MNRAAQEHAVGIPFAQTWGDQLIAAIGGGKRLPVHRRMEGMITGTNKKLWHDQLVGERKEIGRQILVVCGGPSQGGNVKYDVHLIAATHGVIVPFQSRRRREGNHRDQSKKDNDKAALLHNGVTGLSLGDLSIQ